MNLVKYTSVYLDLNISLWCMNFHQQFCNWEYANTTQTIVWKWLILYIRSFVSYFSRVSAFPIRIFIRIYFILIKCKFLHITILMYTVCMFTIYLPYLFLLLRRWKYNGWFSNQWLDNVIGRLTLCLLDISFKLLGIYTRPDNFYIVILRKSKLCVKFKYISLLSKIELSHRKSVKQMKNEVMCLFITRIVEK